MEPTTISTTLINLFAEMKDEFFTIPGLEDLSFSDAEGAIYFLNNVDDLISNYLILAAQQNLDIPESIVMQLGCVVGESYKLIFNGQWIFKENINRWVMQITFPGGDYVEVNAFAKILKRFENGDEDSVVYMFDNIKALYLEKIQELENSEPNN